MYETGKTLRRTPTYGPEERHLCVKTENSKQKSVKIFDNEFHCGLSYSIKKRKRWNISSVLSENIKYGDMEEQMDYQPVTYCMVQILNDKSNYVLDTISKKEIGTRDISNCALPKNPVNYRSVLKELKLSRNPNGTEVSNRSKRQKKSKRGNSKINSDNDLMSSSKENNISQEKEVQNDSIVMSEYYYYNNQITPIVPYTYKVLNKEKKCRVKKINNYEVESEYESYFSDEEDLDDFLTYGSDQKEIQLRDYDITLSIDLKKKKTRKSNKKNRNIHQYQDDLKSDLKIVDTEDFIIYDRDKLPFIIIDETCEYFKEELQNISKSFNCWISDSSPVSVLIDINYLNYKLDKNYIILRPELVKNSTISIKVIFNVLNLDLNEVLKKEFQNIKEIIEFLQIQFDNEKNVKSIIKNEYYELDKPVETLINTWEIKPLDSIKPLFCFNEEWKKFEFNRNILDEILNEKDNKFLTDIMTCNICSNAIPGNDVTIMKKCQHLICGNCLNYHVVDLLKKDALSLTCPVYDCQTHLDCVSILALTCFARYRNRLKLFEEDIVKNYCSSCNSCNVVVILKDKKLISQTQLEYICGCGKIICGYCGNSQHWPTSCDNMKIHTGQTIKLKDNEIKPTTLKSLIITGRLCPNCKTFVSKTKGNRVLKCVCQLEFCFTCGKSHTYKRKGVSCTFDLDNLPLTYDLTKYDLCPNPDSARSKYYCESINIRIMSHPINVLLLKKKLMKIDLKIKNCKNMNTEHKNAIAQYSQDSKILNSDLEYEIAQYSQILSIIESIYVSIYQMKRNENPRFRNFLKISAKNLMFYIYKLEAIVTEINEQILQKETNKLKIDEISRKREMFNVYLKDALDFVTKLQILIR